MWYIALPLFFLASATSKSTVTTHVSGNDASAYTQITTQANGTSQTVESHESGTLSVQNINGTVTVEQYPAATARVTLYPLASKSATPQRKHVRTRWHILTIIQPLWQSFLTMLRLTNK